MSTNGSKAKAVVESPKAIFAAKGSQAAYKDKVVYISEPNIQIIPVRIVGTADLVQSAVKGIPPKTAPGKRPKKTVRTEQEQFQDSIHVSEAGWNGIPASAFRNGMIDACRLTDQKMVIAKITVFVESDGSDKNTGIPLVKITKGKPELFSRPVRNENSGQWTQGISARYRAGWEAIVRVAFDADMIDEASVVNLLMRVGKQVGIGMGRPMGRNGNGCGWGLFKITK